MKETKSMKSEDVDVTLLEDEALKEKPAEFQKGSDEFTGHQAIEEYTSGGTSEGFTAEESAGSATTFDEFYKKPKLHQGL